MYLPLLKLSTQDWDKYTQQTGWFLVVCNALKCMYHKYLPSDFYLNIISFKGIESSWAADKFASGFNNTYNMPFQSP